MGIWLALFFLLIILSALDGVEDCSCAKKNNFCQYWACPVVKGVHLLLQRETYLISVLPHQTCS